MRIFHSYVSLPEGNGDFFCGYGSREPWDHGVPPRLAVASEVTLCCLGSQDVERPLGGEHLFNMFGRHVLLSLEMRHRKCNFD